MAVVSATITCASDYIQIDTVESTGYTLYRSFTNDSDYADAMTKELSSIDQFIDISVVQRWTYHYWLEILGSYTYIGSGRLTQPVLYGRRGAQKKFPLDRTVECPLCGFEAKKRVMKRGYVKPHITGENYLPNSAAPEKWTYTVYPEYYDINAYYQWNDIEKTVVFPHWEKEFGYWQPGVPIFKVSSVVTIGTPSASKTGYIILHLYSLADYPLTIYILNPAATLTLSSVDLSLGWNRVVGELSWVSTSSLKVWLSLSGAPGVPYVGFGGAQLVTREPELASLPDRETGSGDYTTGGLMDLCPKCYSGLRRRVPWE